MWLFRILSLLLLLNSGAFADDLLIPDIIPFKGILPSIRSKEVYHQIFSSAEDYLNQNMSKKGIAKIIMVRHGQSQANSIGLNAGRQQSPLTAQGIEQAKNVGRYLATKNLSFDICYVTPIQRTSETFDMINKIWTEIRKVSLPGPLVEERLIERCGGMLEGMAHELYKPYKDAENRFLKDLKHTFEEIFNYRMVEDGQYESLKEVLNRVRPALIDMAISHSEKNIFVVAHVGIFRSILVAAATSYINPHLFDWNSIDIPNGSIIILESDGSNLWLKATSEMNFK